MESIAQTHRLSYYGLYSVANLVRLLTNAPKKKKEKSKK